MEERYRTAVVTVFTIVKVAQNDGECCGVGVTLLTTFRIAEDGASGNAEKKYTTMKT